MEELIMKLIAEIETFEKKGGTWAETVLLKAMICSVAAIQSKKDADFLGTVLSEAVQRISDKNVRDAEGTVGHA